MYERTERRTQTLDPSATLNRPEPGTSSDPMAPMQPVQVSASNPASTDKKVSIGKPPKTGMLKKGMTGKFGGKRESAGRLVLKMATGTTDGESLGTGSMFRPAPRAMREAKEKWQRTMQKLKRSASNRSSGVSSSGFCEDQSSSGRSVQDKGKFFAAKNLGMRALANVVTSIEQDEDGDCTGSGHSRGSRAGQFMGIASADEVGELREMRNQISFRSASQIPAEFRVGSLEESELYKSILRTCDFLCPRMMAELEITYDIFQIERMEKVGKIELLALVMSMIAVIAVCITALVQNTYDVWSIFFVVLILLLGSECAIFKANSATFNILRRRSLLKWNAIFLMAFVIVWESLCVAISSVEPMRQYMHIVITIAAWGSLPAPVPLWWMLGIIHVAPVCWGWAAQYSEAMSPWLVIEYALYLYWCGLLCFIMCRKHALESRLHFLNDRMTDHIDKHDRKTIATLQTRITTMKNQRKPTEAMFSSLLAQHKERLRKLKDELENPEIKTEIEDIHYDLVSDYVKFAQHIPRDDMMESVVSDLERRFESLKSKSDIESKRLCGIMAALYENLKELPEWTHVVACPSFDLKGQSTKEKLCQSSYCEWWRYPDVVQATVADRIGLEHEPVDWFWQRALWARSTFVSILSDAIIKFNKAEMPVDLDLDPDEVLAKWNEQFPNKFMTSVPFESETALQNTELKMSESMSHEYMQHGRNCGMQIGPNKYRSRVVAKVDEYKNEDPQKYPDRNCLAKYVCDWLRCRVVFANPSALGVFFWYLMYKVPRLQVVVVKNKLLQHPESDTSCNIHLNVIFEVQGEQVVAEVQLLLENFLIAKDLEHKYYEFRRANRLAEVLAPVLEVPVRKKDINKSVTGLSAKSKPSTAGSFRPDGLRDTGATRVSLLESEIHCLPTVIETGNTPNGSAALRSTGDSEPYHIPNDNLLC